MTSRERLRDELLVLRCQTGDSPAFDELVGRWQERLWRYAHHLAGDDDAAWDAVQETWIAVVNGIKRLDDPKAFPAWAYRILTNKCTDQVRTRQRQRRFDEEIAIEDQGTPHKNEKLDSLEAALARLPGETRALLSLHYVDGYSMDEIAAILGIAEGTVKSRLHHARERLRQLME